MSWNNLVGPAAGVAALAIVIGGAASAETLVVRSSGPSMAAYPPGKALADSAQIVLKASDQIVLLDGRGTRTLKGPGTFSPVMASSRAADVRATFADVSGRRARPGAVRGIAPAGASVAKSPNIWFVDTGRSTTSCITDAARVTLWRPDRGQAATMTIAGPGGVAGKVDWAAGESTQTWPAAVPVTPGAEYRLGWAGASRPTVLRFAILGPNPSSGLEDMAAALIRNRCEAQLDLLIETVAIPDVATPPG